MKYLYFLFVVLFTIAVIIDIRTNPIRKEIQKTKITNCEEKRSVIMVGKTPTPITRTVCYNDKQGG